ncbi:MAG: hypothetical protein ACXVWT_28515 [Solirubrobacteraceae bacterium]
MGDTGRHEPHHPDAITDAELQRALADPDPFRGIAQLTARLGAAFTLDPAGVTRSKALGAERMARKLRDALLGGDSSLRNAVWEFMRPLLSLGLAALNPRARPHLRNERRPRDPPHRVKPRRPRPRPRPRSRRARQPSRVVRTHSLPPAQAANGTGRGPRPATRQRVLFLPSWSVQHARSEATRATQTHTRSRIAGSELLDPAGSDIPVLARPKGKTRLQGTDRTAKLI